METNPTYSGTNPTSVGAAAPWHRWLLPGGALALTVALVVVVEWSTLHQVHQLERTLGEARPTSFLVGVRLQEALAQMTAGLLRFKLSNDPAERLGFQDTSRAIADLLARAVYTLRTVEERELAAKCSRTLQEFLVASAPWLDEGVRGIRKDTAVQLQRELATMVRPVQEAAAELSGSQEKSAAQFLGDAQESLYELRRGWMGSLGLFSLLLGGVAFLSYRSLVTPLRRRLDESETLLQRQEHLASLGVLTAGVAHEVRNPLAAIRFRLYSLKHAAPGSADQQEDVDIIEGEIQRLDRIVKELLEFARPSPPDLHPVEIGPLLEGLKTLLAAELERRHVRIEVTPAEPLTVHADRQQLQQVLMNLVRNAAEAMESGGTVTLATRAGAARRARRLEKVVLIEVSDTGPGLDPEVGQRIFDPFFSTKAGGTGLGLPIAARIVEMHGGYLQFTSQPRKGSTFTVALPQRTA